jgi:eukaryotic-like serine/threonine-protein kinase
MSLSSGTKLGAYEIVALLGAGGMGEVYRARDTRLKREVAIKVLPDAFVSDPDRLARFQREAELLATLNHPNIGAVYGFEQSETANAIVLELIEGETLADRILRGAIPVKAALTIALQIAEALEAAHERGVIHRDLKPANIKLTPDDKVKVLDFGLAKAMESTPAGNLTHSPTLSMMGTQAGMILGTAAYMSPEQAKGFPADQRSDVFSFGTVLYEMITGRQPFNGDTAPDVLASVIVRDADLNALPANLNPRLTETLERCLAKNPKKRWQAIGDVRAEIEKIALAPHSTPVAAAIPHRTLWQRTVPVVMTAVACAVIGSAAAWYYRPAPESRRPMRFVMTLPQGQAVTNTVRQIIDISADGSRMLYAANQTLFVREMSEFTARPVSGVDATQGGLVNPIFSPDGQSIAYYSGTELAIKRVAISGGAPTTVCKVDAPIFGMSWSGDEIFYGQGPGGIMRVADTGGKPESLARMQPGEFAFGPQILPGRRNVLFTIARGIGLDRWDKGTVVIQAIGSDDRRTVINGGSDGRYMPITETKGYLFYAIAGVAFAVPFDLQRLETTAAPTPVLEGVRRSSSNAQATTQMAMSSTGTLVYFPGPITSLARGLGLLNRDGIAQAFNVSSGPYFVPRVSPDGKQVAFVSDDGKDTAVWIYDVSGKSSMRRVTFAGRNQFPIWSRDGQYIVFQSNRDGTEAIFHQRADGNGTAKRLTSPASGVSHAPDVWLPSGDGFLYTETKGSESTVWVFTLKDGKAAPFGGLRSSVPLTPVFSPDGKWLAYTSLETGLNQVFVQPVPMTGAKYQVSKKGGHHPLWSPNGRELIYDVTAGLSEIVTVTFEPAFDVSNPRILPRGSMLFSGTTSPRPVDMSPDGRILGAIMMGENADLVNAPPMHIVLNWLDELKQRVPLTD